MRSRGIKGEGAGRESAGDGWRRAGITLLELVVVLSIIGILIMIAAPIMTRWQADLNAKQAARGMADLLLLARSESIRTGHQHVVFFGPPGSQDPAGTSIQDGAGNYVPMLMLDDGPQTTANCRIDPGEATEVVQPARDVQWGVSLATTRAPHDAGLGAFSPPQSSGHTFVDPTGTARSWLLFRADGTPAVFTGTGGNCGIVGPTGTGGAALYLTNGKRDYAVVLSPLGTVRIHASEGGAWSS